ncbi:MAG: response regulator [Microbacteriaceae bacterium]
MIRILLLDDHPVLRHGVRSLLDTQSDFEVVADVGSAAEAAAAAPDIDIALVDLDLGDDAPDGFDAIREIRRANTATSVLVFTAYDSDADIVRALDAGAAGYLVKDSRPADLFRAIITAAEISPRIVP